MKSILIVEDENIIASSIKSVLKRIGYKRAFIAKSSQEALEVLKNEKPDIALCDIVIEGDKNGIELAQLIKDTYNIPVIFLSAHSDETIVNQAKLTQPYGYITKPFKVDELRIALDIALYNFQMERNLVESEEKYHLLTEAVMDIIFTLDIDGKFTFLNSAFHKITEFSNNEFLGKHFKSLIIPENVDETIEIFKREHLLDGIPFYEVDILHKKKGSISVEINITQLFDEDGNKTGYIGTMRDVTIRKHAEEELRRAYELLENTQHELVQTKTLANLGEFAAGIAHEIRNPLANISALAQYSMKKFVIDKPIKDNLEAILRSTERANRIIVDLLEFAKPRALDLEYADICEIIANVCSRTEANRLNQQIRLIKRCSKSMPDISIDKKQIEQAFINIVMNSLDAMKHGGTLSITASKNENYILVTISDTGRGMPKKYIEKIFNPFFTTKQKGVGLGLSVTHRILQSHNVRIEVKSKYNKGTTFHMYFPLNDSNKSGV